MVAAELSRVLPEPIRRALDALGEIRSLSEIPGATQGQVYRVEVAHGHERRWVALKIPSSPAARQREQGAYERLAGPLAGCMPALLLALDEGLILEWIEGPNVASIEAGARKQALLRQAGAVRKQLNELIKADDVLSAVDALSVRMRTWAERARELMPPAIVACALRRFDPGCAHEIPRAFCHRDFTADNWIAGPGDELRIIDWGHARFDLWLWDLVKLNEGMFSVEPDARHAFFEGLGRELSAAEELCLEHLGILHGLQTACWGLRHGDAALAALGREILERRLEV